MTSPYHQKIKFPVGAKLSKVRGDQQASQKCYVEMVHMDQKRSRPRIIMGERKRSAEEVQIVQKEDSTFSASEELEEIIVEPNHPEKTIWISRELLPRLKREFVDYLVWNKDIFTWSKANLVGISLEVMEHRLHILPTTRLIK